MNSGLRENVFLITDMKINFFMAIATLVVSVAAVVGVKAYNYYSMPELMRANLEALTQNDVGTCTIEAYCETIIPFANCYHLCDCGKEWYDARYGKVGKLIRIKGKCSCGRIATME